jgi:protoporphyrinogen/coproporphyrinogen III oxidase
VRRIGVIGGGLAGLTVAFRRANAGDEVVLLEGAPRLGGQLWTERSGGFVVEHGAEGFVASSKLVPALAESLGIAGALVGQSTMRSWGFDGATLIELGPGEAAAFLGFGVPREEMGKGIRTFLRGMGQLADALEQALQARAAEGRVKLRRGARVASIAKAGDVWRITLASGGVDEVEEVARVVVATTAAAAAPILEGAFGDPARALAGSPTLSSVTVTLAYPREAIAHSMEGTGFVVAEPHQKHGFRASTFITSKFPARAPEGLVALRLFYRPAAEDLAGLSDEAWIARAEESLGRVLPVTGKPVRSWVSRWGSALPVFEAAHSARVKALEAAMAGSGVILAGSAFHGSGIDAAVRSAEAAAKALGEEIAR